MANVGRAPLGRVYMAKGSGVPPSFATLISSDNSITFAFTTTSLDLTVTGGSSVGTTLTGNDLVAISPIGGNWNIFTASTTAKFLGTAGTLTLDFGLDNLFIGTSGTITTGSLNTCLGRNAGRFITSGQNSVYIGWHTGQNATTGNSNTIVGSQSFLNYTTSGVSPDGNVVLGASAATTLGTGRYNIIMGIASGNSLGASDSSNILIHSDGVSGESNATRIGRQGSGLGEQTDCYLAGILHTTSGRTVKLTVPGAYPYTVLSTDYIIRVDTSAARTINLPNAPTTGTVYVIKDVIGTAAAFNISITTPGGTVTIDGSTTFTISTNYGSITVFFSGTAYFII